MYKGWIALFLSAVAAQSPPPPRDWTDASTGHRVIRLSDGGGTESLYFHQNGYTAKGDKLVVTTRAGLSTIDLGTRKIEPLVQGRVSHVVVGRNTRQAFYIKDGSVYSTDIDTRSTKAILQRRELSSGSGLSVNSDETMLAGSFVEDGSQAPPVPPGGSSLEVRWAAHLPMALYTIEIKTGKLKIFHHSTDWLNHVQFSPTDPDLLMFCHEGPWHKVDRIWTIRTDDTGLRKIHSRTMDMEIAGHEFFSRDGKIIWYDLQTPKSEEFWLAGLVLATGERIRYKLDRAEWSVHFNASPDGTLFAGDGGGPRSVAAPGNGQWIYLFRAENGVLKSEKLVNLRDHNYNLEPNVTFTPDQKWIVFRSNMHGAPHVYAVEVQRN
jgi:oligogalacturonide lyase